MDFTNFVNQWNIIDTNIETNPGKYNKSLLLDIFVID